MAKHGMSRTDHQRVAEAIRSAEANTSGEIYCVLARSSDSYFFPAAFLASMAMLLVSLVVALILESWWVSIRPALFIAAQILAVLSLLALLWVFPDIRSRLVPASLRYRRAHMNAMSQFLGRNIHITSARTGVLLFLSLEERYAEVVADSGINERVSQDSWVAVVETLTANAREGRIADGFVAATERVGAILAEHFPRHAGDVNELKDHLVEI